MIFSIIGLILVLVAVKDHSYFLAIIGTVVATIQFD